MAERKTRTFDGAAPSTTIRCTEGLNEMAEELAVSKQASAPWYQAALIIPIDPALGVLRQASVGALVHPEPRVWSYRQQAAGDISVAYQ